MACVLPSKIFMDFLEYFQQLSLVGGRKLPEFWDMCGEKAE